MNKIQVNNFQKYHVEQAYASASQVLSEEQKRKLIQDKFERAKIMSESLNELSNFHEEF